MSKKILVHKESGAEVEVLNEVQESAFKNEGFVEKEDKPKKVKE